MDIDPSTIDDFIPMVDNIGWAMLSIRQYRSGGALVMRAEDILTRLAEETREERPDTKKCDNVVNIIQ